MTVVISRAAARVTIELKLPVDFKQDYLARKAGWRQHSRRAATALSPSRERAASDGDSGGRDRCHIDWRALGFDLVAGRACGHLHRAGDLHRAR